jgi:hypothetical protein
MPPTVAPFSVTAFLRAQSPRPTSVIVADSTLAAALESAETKAAAAQERARLATLTWEHERATADALASQVAEAEHFLHTSAVEHASSSFHQASPTAPVAQSTGTQLGQVDPMTAYLHLQAAGVPHIKNLVTVLLDSTSTYARWRDQILLALHRYALDDHVLIDTPTSARDLGWQRLDSIATS